MSINTEDISLPLSIIEGVTFKELKTFSDGRGFFRELVRFSDPFFEEGFAQWSHSFMRQNTVKAWHFHHRQIDWWYLPLGVAQIVLYDNRDASPTYENKMEFYLGENELDSRAIPAVVRIPQGVLHGCKVLSEAAHLFYITSEIYDPQDEGRLPFNSNAVPHNWGNENQLNVNERDRATFIPPYELRWTHYSSKTRK